MASMYALHKSKKARYTWPMVETSKVAVTHDPNKKEDRPILKRGEYMAGASIAAGI